ncbi:hypothetical protein RYX36_009266 [Vicia faba]
MGKKRKSTATSLDEVDRTMYASFCTTANSISQLYTHAMNHQKLSFHAGELLFSGKDFEKPESSYSYRQKILFRQEFE